MPENDVRGQIKRDAVVPFDPAHAVEVSSFLDLRPIQTVILRSGIGEPVRSDGEPSRRYYCYFGFDGTLEGVGLFGPLTLIETRNFYATQAFADLARRLPPFKVAIAEKENMRLFWDAYAQGCDLPRFESEEFLYKYNGSDPKARLEPRLRLAVLSDLDTVVNVHAPLVESETGLNPLREDPEGFRLRCAKRIEGGSVWILKEDDKLIFKVEIAAESGTVKYLEGLWTNPDARSRGVAISCLNQLRKNFFPEEIAICGFVSSSNFQARSFFTSVGGDLTDVYSKIYLRSV